MATVLQISDTHLRAEPHTPSNRDPDAALTASLAPVSGVRPDLLLLTGDLADDGTVTALRRLRDALDGFDAPMLAVSGNHDEPHNVRAVFGEADTYDVGAWRVVAVETFVPRQIHGAVDVDDVVKRLDSLDERPTLIAMHHPPRSPSTHNWFRLIGADAFVDAIVARPHVRAIASGHLHELFHYELGRDRQVELCGAPSAYYAIEHHGDRYELVGSGLVGTQLLTLNDDGSFACQPVPRSLGC
jgi:Icc protein